MAVIIAPEICIIQGIFKGFEACKNSEYSFFKWCPQNRSNVPIERKDLVKMSESSALLNLEVGKNYNFQTEITIQQPQDNGDRVYPARIQYRPIKVV